MRFTTIILVIAGLAAFASANGGKDDDTLYNDELVKKCIYECGRGPHCKHYCQCVIHKMPDVKCRKDDCKKPPKGCAKYGRKRDADQATSEGVDQATSEDADQATSEDADQATTEGVDQAVSDVDQTHPEDIDYNRDAPESNNGTVIIGDTSGNTCVTQGCDVGLPYCLEKCGYGPQCEGYCACYLHSNPKSICRQQGCVGEPQGCDKWEFSEHDTALAGPDTVDFDRVAAAANAQEASDDDDDYDYDFSGAQCQACRDAEYKCSKGCGGEDMACRNSCLCSSTEGDSCTKCKSAGCPRS